MKALKVIILVAISSVALGDGQFKLPNPLTRVSGRSFIPNKSRNIDMIKIEPDMVVKTLSARKSSKLATKSVGLEFCKACIEFADQALDYLLNAVLNIGVIGSCGTICQWVEEKSGSKILGLGCNLLCDYAGIDEFIKIIEEADLDPIWYCELLRACEIFDGGDANITSFTVNPKQGPQGTFMIGYTFVSKNGTGTGEMYVGIKTVDGVPVENSFLMLPLKPGVYSSNIELDAQPDPDCDPSQGPCESWLPGKYQVEMGMN